MDIQVPPLFFWCSTGGALCKCRAADGTTCIISASSITVLTGSFNIREKKSATLEGDGHGSSCNKTACVSLVCYITLQVYLAHLTIVGSFGDELPREALGSKVHDDVKSDELGNRRDSTCLPIHFHLLEFPRKVLFSNYLLCHDY